MSPRNTEFILVLLFTNYCIISHKQLETGVCPPCMFSSAASELLSRQHLTGHARRPHRLPGRCGLLLSPQTLLSEMLFSAPPRSAAEGKQSPGTQPDVRVSFIL